MKLSFNGLRLWLSNLVFCFSIGVIYFIYFIYFLFPYLFFIYYYFFETRLRPRGIVFCWIHVLINFTSCFKFGCFFFLFFSFFSGLFPISGVFQFWAFGLSSEICNLFIRHSLCTTVTSAGFSSGPRTVFPVGQRPLLGFSFLLLLALCLSSVG